MIDRAISNTAGLQGIIGASLPAVTGLDLRRISQDSPQDIESAA